MENDVQRIAALAHVDEKLDEMHEELGDLPKQVKKLEGLVRERSNAVEATQGELTAAENFRSTSNVMLQEFGDKQKKLTDSQSSVRNNKEFDAITKELEFIRTERIRIEGELAQTSVKEENWKNMLVGQQAELLEAQTNLAAKEQELDHLSNEQNDEFKQLQAKRKSIIAGLNAEWYSEYERIRTYHSDAAVHIRKGSCSGCFSAIPPQRQVEMRNNKEAFFSCQICGRILYPEELRVEEEFV